MVKYINQDKILHDHKNDNEHEDIVTKAFIVQIIKFIEKFPTTDIQFKNGTIYVNARSMIKEGAEND